MTHAAEREIAAPSCRLRDVADQCRLEFRIAGRVQIERLGDGFALGAGEFGRKPIEPLGLAF